MTRRSEARDRRGIVGACLLGLGLGLVTLPAWAQGATWEPTWFNREDIWRPLVDPIRGDLGSHLFVCALGHGRDEPSALEDARARARSRAAGLRAAELASTLGSRALGSAPGATGPLPGEVVREEQVSPHRAAGAVRVAVCLAFPEAWVRPRTRLVALERDAPPGVAPAPAWRERALALATAYEGEGLPALARATLELALARAERAVPIRLALAAHLERQGARAEAWRLLEAGLARAGAGGSELPPDDLVALGLALAGALERGDAPGDGERALQVLRELRARVGPGAPRERLDAALDARTVSWSSLETELRDWARQRASAPLGADFRPRVALRPDRALELEARGARGRPVVWLWVDGDGLYRYHVHGPGDRGTQATAPLEPGQRALVLAVAVPEGTGPPWLAGREGGAPGPEGETPLVRRRDVDDRDPAAARAFRALLRLEGAWAEVFDVQAGP